MILLDATTKKLEFLLGGAVTTNELDFVAIYADHTTSTFVPGAADGVSDGATPVTLVAAPAADTQRQVKYLSIFNADTVAATVTVQVDVSATDRVLVTITLAVGDTLAYTDGEGFRVVDSSGQVKVAPDASVPRVDVAETVTADWTHTGDLLLEGRTSRGKQSETLGAAATTFAVTSDFVEVTGDAGANTIATITGGLEGQVLTILFVDALVTITDDNSHAANSVDLSAAFTSADDAVLQLIFDGTSWYEVSRSTN